MQEQNYFALRSTRVVTSVGMRNAVVVVKGDAIEDVVAAEAYSGDAIDCGNLVISPGLIDPHVHINEPGRTEWEGFATATRAAAAGGITSLVDMPLNSSPVTTSVQALEGKLTSAEGKLNVDCGFHGGLIPANAAGLGPLLESGILGVKAFLAPSGIEEFPNVTETDLRNAMPLIAESGLPLLVHAELASFPQPLSEAKGLTASKDAKILRSAQNWKQSRPRKWENDAVALLIRLCEEFGCRVHIVHVSSSEVVPLLRAAKQKGLPITAETCPHYLVFASEEIPDGATQFKCAPPIRERENKEQLWHALREGVIDFVASDHSPCPPAMKLSESGDFLKAWGGIASLQLGLSIMWTAARTRGFQLADLSRWMSANPAVLAGLE
ncbi:MAG: allantoinase AllB, partial [Ignavibacteriae bacterium]|nr:allantoinase AllB [Ignavibacteriota bacterium]